MNPFFSLIIPVYNVEQFLPFCLDSILRQNFLEFEIILVDDGSQDLSGEICEEYSKKDNRIKVFHKENGGQSSARNVGLLFAKGKYVIFVDSDDALADNCLSQLQTLIREKDECEIYQIGSSFFKKSYNKKKTFFKGPVGICFADGQDYLKKCLRTTFCSTVWSYIYSLDFLKKNNLVFMEGVYHEDEEFIPRVLLLTKTIRVIDYDFYYYRIRTGSTMNSKNMSKNADDILKISYSLYNRFADIEDKQLKSLLLDRLVSFHISAFMMGKYYKKGLSHKIDKTFMKRNAYSRKNKIKVNILCLSKHLFYFLENSITHLKGFSL